MREEGIPRKTLFSAQRHFLERIFRMEGVRNDKVTVTATDGKEQGPYVFACDISTKACVHSVITRVVESDWGAFEVKGLEFSNAEQSGKVYAFVHVRFFVDLKESR